MIRRVFTKGVGEISRSIRITKETETALAQLSDDVGESINSYVGLVLDAHLQEKALEGVISWPRGFDPKTLKKKL